MKKLLLLTVAFFMVSSSIFAAVPAVLDPESSAWPVTSAPVVPGR